jgi:hypothetical protein
MSSQAVIRSSTRFHPAEARIRKLSEAPPATLMRFDLLLDTNGRPRQTSPRNTDDHGSKRFSGIAQATGL